MLVQIMGQQHPVNTPDMIITPELFMMTLLHIVVVHITGPHTQVAGTWGHHSTGSLHLLEKDFDDNNDDSDDSLENVDVTKVTGVPDGSPAPTESCYDSTCQ